MAIRITCQCGNKLRAPNHFAGKRAKCPKCGAFVDVPVAASHVPADSKVSVPTSEKDASRLFSAERPRRSAALYVAAIAAAVLVLTGIMMFLAISPHHHSTSPPDESAQRESSRGDRREDLEVNIGNLLFQKPKSWEHASVVKREEKVMIELRPQVDDQRVALSIEPWKETTDQPSRSQGTFAHVVTRRMEEHEVDKGRVVLAELEGLYRAEDREAALARKLDQAAATKGASRDVFAPGLSDLLGGEGVMSRVGFVPTVVGRSEKEASDAYLAIEQALYGNGVQREDQRKRLLVTVADLHSKGVLQSINTFYRNSQGWQNNGRIVITARNVVVAQVFEDGRAKGRERNRDRMRFVMVVEGNSRSDDSWMVQALERLTKLVALKPTLSLREVYSVLNANDATRKSELRLAVLEVVSGASGTLAMRELRTGVEMIAVVEHSTSKALVTVKGSRKAINDRKDEILEFLRSVSATVDD